MNVEPIVLEGRSVRLEPLAPAHAGALTDALDPALTQWFPKPMVERGDIDAFIADALAGAGTGTVLPFATIDCRSGKVVGSTRFAAIDRANRRAEIGWTFVARRFQRTAINTEAKLLMLTHAFEAWQCIRIEFKTDSLNLQSRNALLRLGAREEGIFRNHVICASGRIRHSVYFSITIEEWPETKARLAARLAQS